MNAVFDVVIDVSKLGEIDGVQLICKRFQSNTPGVVNWAGVRPIARPAPKDTFVGGEVSLGRFDDVEEGDSFRRSGETVPTFRSSGRGEKPLRDKVGKDMLQEIRGDVHGSRNLASLAWFAVPVKGQIKCDAERVVSMLTECHRHSSPITIQSRL